MSGVFSQTQYIKAPVLSVADLPDSDMIGALRVVTSVNEIYIRNAGAWEPAVSGSLPTWITSLTGDVTTSNILSGVATATVARVGGVSSASVASTYIKVAQASSDSSVNTLVQRNMRGEIGVSSLVADSVLTDNLSADYAYVDEFLKVADIISNSLESETLIVKNSIEAKTIKGNSLEVQTATATSMTLNSNPVNDLDATNKRYVDTAIGNATDVNRSVNCYGTGATQSIPDRVYTAVQFPWRQWDISSGSTGVLGDLPFYDRFVYAAQGESFVICVSYSVQSDNASGFKYTQIDLETPKGTFTLAANMINPTRNNQGTPHCMTGTATFKIFPGCSFRIVFYQATGAKLNLGSYLTNVQIARIG